MRRVLWKLAMLRRPLGHGFAGSLQPGGVYALATVIVPCPSQRQLCRRSTGDFRRDDGRRPAVAIRCRGGGRTRLADSQIWNTTAPDHTAAKRDNAATGCRSQAGGRAARIPTIGRQVTRRSGHARPVEAEVIEVPAPTAGNRYTASEGRIFVGDTLSRWAAGRFRGVGEQMHSIWGGLRSCLPTARLLPHEYPLATAASRDRRDDISHAPAARRGRGGASAARRRADFSIALERAPTVMRDHRSRCARASRQGQFSRLGAVMPLRAFWQLWRMA